MKPFTKISAMLFAVVALLHLMRLIFHFQLMVLNTEVPLWINIAGMIIASVISIGLWRESGR